MPSLALACRLSAVSMALRQAYPDAFDPASLFAAGEQGLWYDISDFDRYMSELGPDIVVNGGFDDGLTGWSNAGATISVTDGVLLVSGSLSYSRANTIVNLPLEVGKYYVVSGDVKNGAAPEGGRIEVWGAQVGPINTPTVSDTESFRRVSAPFRADNSSCNIRLVASAGGLGGSAFYDNISVRELTAINTATLFQDAAGNIPVTAVEQPVGLILDKSKGLVLGPELWSTSLPLNGTVNAGWSYADGVFTTTTAQNYSSPTNFQPHVSVPGVLPGRTYKVTVVVTGSGTAGISVGVTGVDFRPAGTYEYSRLVTSTLYPGLIVQAGSNFVGTVRVTSIRELLGNHASQANAPSRGVLRARYNLLTFAEDFSQSVWVKSVVTISAASNPPEGSQVATRITSLGDASFVRQIPTGIADGRVVGRFRLRKAGNTWVRCQISDLTNAYGTWFNFDTVSFGQEIFAGTQSSTSRSVESLGGGWYEITLSAKLATATSAGGIVVSANADGSVLGGWGWTVDCAGVDIRQAGLPASLPPYQRIAAATDYDTVGFPVYIDPDGTDDSYQTGNIDFTGTDKVTIWAGLRKVDDTARMLCELSASAPGNAGSFYVVTGLDQSSMYSTIARGTTPANSNQIAKFNPNLYPAPDSAVITAQHDIAGDLSRIRRNGSSTGAIDGTFDKGTGNFGNYPLYLFSRSGTSLRWKGQFYGLIIRGAATDATQLEQTEQWLNAKMGGIY